MRRERLTPPRTVDLDEKPGYFNTPRFAVYCSLLRASITRMVKQGISPSIGDQKRDLGERFWADAHMDALSQLETEMLIEKVNEIAPVRWTLKTATERAKPEPYGLNFQREKK